MTPRTRLSNLIRDYHLDDTVLPALTALVQALADEGAPTSVHRPTQVVDVHVADSLAALAVPGVRHARRVADLGAGAGLPGLVLAAAVPCTQFALVESNARKCDFIRQTVMTMALANVTVIQSRVEDWRDASGGHDFVCARAVAALPVLLEYAAPLLRIGGLLVAWKGEVGQPESIDAAAAASLLGCEAAGVLAVTPFATSDRRTLHLFRKVEETPPRYPRRAGMASKRPLAAKQLHQRKPGG